MAVGALLLAAGVFAIPLHGAPQASGGYADTLVFSVVPQDQAVPTVSKGRINIAYEFVDQSFLPPPHGVRQIHYSMPVGQEFTPTEPTLVAVDVRLASMNPSYGDDTITVTIRKGTIGSPVLATKSQVVWVFFSGLVHFHFPTSLSVIPGDVYVLEVQATKPTHGWNFDVGYPSGRSILFGQPEILGDYAFQTYYFEPLRFPVPDLVVTCGVG